MITEKDLRRLQELEPIIYAIGKEWGLNVSEIVFEIVPAQRVLEGMAYDFPTNFSHWSRGRDYEKYRTIYEHTGAGIPYEEIWNFETPRAFLVETNPFALNVLVLAHCIGHNDYFRRSKYLRRSRDLADMAEAARSAAERFNRYEERFGQEEVEKVIDAGMSIRWHQDPDPFADDIGEEDIRERLLEMDLAKLKYLKALFFKSEQDSREIAEIEKRLRLLRDKTPPIPNYDVLDYVIRHSPRRLKAWEQDVLTTIRTQSRFLAPQRRTKMLDEGWSVFWHVRILRRLFEEGLLSPEEHGVFNEFHAGVMQESRFSFNWYRIGFYLWEYIKERWDKGQFGVEYEDSKDPLKRARWDRQCNLGTQKIFDVAESYSDRMAIEEFFTDDFINEQQLYIYQEKVDQYTGDVIAEIVEDRPEVIRAMLRRDFALYGIPLVRVEDGNYKGNGELYLTHEFSGFELDPEYRDKTLEKLQFLWGRSVHLETVEEGRRVLFSKSSGGSTKVTL